MCILFLLRPRKLTWRQDRDSLKKLLEEEAERERFAEESLGERWSDIRLIPIVPSEHRDMD